MEITEVRIKLMEDSDDRLRAFCSITFDDCFVVRDLKIIDGANGPFVAMPSRKLTGHCPFCRAKNQLRARYCNQCGKLLPEDRTQRDQDGRVKLYADIAHPINSDCREMIQQRVIAEYGRELELSEKPGYKSRYDDEYDDFDDDEVDTFNEDSPRGEQDTAIHRKRDNSDTGPSESASTHIDKSQPTPPPPHQGPGKSQSARSSQHRDKDSFGFGIFDD